MSSRLWLALALLLAACGPGTPPAPLAPRIEPGPWAPPAWHPPGAALQGLARVQALGPALAPLLDPRIPEALRAPAARLHRALQAVPWASLGLSPRHPISFSLRASPGADLQAALDGLQAALDGLGVGERPEGLTPLPPAWIQLRLVGAAAPPVPGVDGQIAAWLGGHQRFALTEAQETAAVALGLPPEALAGLAPLGGSRFFSLIETDLPVLLRLETTGEAAVVDLIVDLSLGEGAFAAALHALPELANPPTYAPALDPLPAALGLWAWLALDAYAALVRVGIEAASAWPVLGLNPLREEPGPVLARSRAEARARLAPLAGARGPLTLTLSGPRLTLVGAPGPAPTASASPGLDLVALQAVGALAVRYTPPAAPPAPPPPEGWAEHLAGLGRCGPSCLPAGWPGLAALLSGGPAGLAGLLPPDHPLAAALPGLLSLGLALDAAGQPRLTALTVRDPAPWAQALPEAAVQRPVAEGSLLLGGAEALVAGAAAAPLTPPDAILRAGGALGAGAFDLRFDRGPDGAPRLEAWLTAPAAAAP